MTRRLALEEGVPSGRDFQFYRASLFCRVDQRWDRQARVEAHDSLCATRAPIKPPTRPPDTIAADPFVNWRRVNIDRRARLYYSIRTNVNTKQYTSGPSYYGARLGTGQ